MVEQAHAGECHGDTVFVAGLNHIVVAHGTSGLGNELHSTLVGALDIVAKGEEGVAAKCHTSVAGNPLLFLLTAQWLGAGGEELLPCALAQYVVVIIADIHVDGVVAVGTADAIDKWKTHHFRVLAKPPDVGLVACEACAMDAALLSGTDSDGLSVFHIAYAVALCVFQRNQRDDEVAAGFIGESLVLGGDVLEEGRGVELDFVATLLESDAKDLFALQWVGCVGGVDTDDIVSALALGAQDVECLGRIAGGNHSVAHLTLQQCGCHGVASVAQSHEIAVTAHAVGSTGAGIGTGEGGKFLFDVVDKIDFAQGVAQWETHGGSGGGDMLETGGGGETGGGFQLLHQLPTVESVEKVDVTGTAIKHFDGQLTIGHEYARRLLIGIAAVLQG